MLDKKAKNKILIAIAPDANLELERLATKYSTTKADTIRRALALFIIVDQSIEENSKRRLAITEGRKIIEIFPLI